MRHYGREALDGYFDCPSACATVPLPLPEQCPEPITSACQCQSSASGYGVSVRFGSVSGYLLKCKYEQLFAK